jgi:hypothetical protein
MWVNDTEPIKRSHLAQYLEDQKILNDVKKYLVSDGAYTSMSKISKPTRQK